MVSPTLFSSDTGEWETPQDFFDQYDKFYGFTLDAAASHENTKCYRYFTNNGEYLGHAANRIGDADGLTGRWGDDENVWLNPPYGRGVGAWVEKAYWEHVEHGNFVCMLLPARTDTKWFHEWIYKTAEIEFIKGRLKFGGCPNPAPFPSMVVTFG